MELKHSFRNVSTYSDINIEAIEINKPKFAPHFEKLKNILSDAMKYIPEDEPEK